MRILSIFLILILVPVLLPFGGARYSLAAATITSTTQSAFQSDRLSWQQTLTGSFPVTEATQAGLQVGMGGASGKRGTLRVLDPQFYVIGRVSTAVSVRLALQPGWGTRSRWLGIQNRWDGGLALSPPEFSLIRKESWKFQLGAGLTYWHWTGNHTVDRISALSAYEGSIPDDWGVWIGPRLGLSVSDSIELALSLKLQAGEWEAQTPSPIQTSEIATQLEVNYQWSQSVHVHSHLRHQSFGIRLREETPSMLSIGTGMEIQVW